MSTELTKHEAELLDLFVGGASNREAAVRLGLAKRKVEQHRHTIMQKLGVKTAPQLGYLYATLRRQGDG